MIQPLTIYLAQSKAKDDSNVKKQDEMERHHFSIASKWTIGYFFIALFIYSVYTKITTGQFDIIWLILMVGLVLFWGILTWHKYHTRL